MRHRAASLHRTLLIAAGIVGGIAVVAMVGVGLMTDATARELASYHREVRIEERIADRLMEATYAQRSAAIEYAQAPHAAIEARFRARGQEAYAAVREYLLLPMPLEARLQVERVKEAHERFEVQANRAFEATEADRRAAVSAIFSQENEFARTLNAFVAARDAQHAAFTEENEQRLARLQAITIVLALGVVLMLLLAAYLLRRIVLRPLKEFERAARALGAGDTNVRVPVQAFSEFATVADSFNQMAVSLRDSHKLLEERNRALLQAMDELRRTQHDLVQHEKLSAMGEMLAGLAHELNNPLAAILASAEVLQVEMEELARAQGDDARRLSRELAMPLVKETRRARDLVRNLLNLSRRSGGEARRVQLADAVRDAASLRNSAFAQRGKGLDVCVPDDLFVLVDPIRLQVALVNLFNNALDALVERGTRVQVNAHRQGDEVILIVEDDGTGFTEPERVLEPFYTTKPVGKGTGLGLALVHRFIQDAGGSVKVENAPHGGAVIRLALPFAPEHGSPTRRSATPAYAPLVAEPIASGNPGALLQEFATSGGRKPLVLVVDDEEAMRIVQSRLLRRMGADVLLAESGIAAQQLLHARTVDLVISDVRMPGECDGPGLIRWMRDHFPRLAESAFLMTGDLQLSAFDDLRISADRLLPKPFDLAEYVERVGGALEDALNTA